MFSIIVVNWNGERYLTDFFSSLQSQSYKDFKVYFVDNGSTDNSISVVNNYTDRLNIHTIKLSNNVGFAEANNVGIKSALQDSSEFIITLNNDIELDANCLLNLKEDIRNNDGFDAFQILMLNYHNRDLIDAAGISFNKFYYATQNGYKENVSQIDSINTNIQGVCAGAAAYSKKALEIIKDKEGNYFDPRYFAYFEDVDLALRLLKNNLNSRLVKDSVVFHIHSGTSGKDSSFKTYYLSRNLLMYTKKNLSKFTFYKNAPIYYLRLMAQALKYTLKRDNENSKAVFKGIVDSWKVKTTD